MNRRLAAAVAALVIAFATMALAPTPVSAAGPKTYQWTGATSTAWGTAGNWAGNEVPEEMSIVTITSGSNKSVTGIPSITLAAFTLGPDMTLQSGGGITAATVTLNGGTTNVSITADVLLTLQQTDSERPIVISGDSDTAVTSNLEMVSFGGTKVETYFDADLVNNGVWTLMPGIISQRTEVAVNRCCSGSPSLIDNNGTINQIGDDSTLRVSNGLFISRPGSKVMAPIEIVGGEPRAGGLVKVVGPTGALRLSQNAVLKGLLTADPTIELRNGGAFSQASGSVIAAPVTFTKTGTGVADYDWYGGDITGAVTIGENVNLRLRNTATRGFRPPKPTDTLTIRGRMVFHADSTLQIAGRVVNTGTIAANQGTNGEILGMSCCTDPYKVVNSGMMTATGSGSSLTVSFASLMSVGPDSVLRGTIIMDSGINKIGNGATVKGETTRVSIINRGVLRGEGDVTIELGAKVLWRGFSTIRGAADFTVGGKGRLIWNSGSLVGRLTTGRDTTLELVDLAGEIDPVRTIDTDGRDSVLTTKGDVIQRADLRLNGSTFDAVVTNQGTWTQKKGGVLRWGASAAQNKGRLVVDGETASTVTRWNADRVVIDGDVDVDKGDLFIEPTIRFRQTGGDVTVSKDSVLFVDDTYRLDDGRLRGNGVVETSLLVNDGEVQPSPGKARLRLIGDYRQSEEGKLTIELGPDSASNLKVSGRAFLAGTVKVTTTGSLPVRGTGSVIVEARDRIGTFDDLVGRNASRLRFAPTNDSMLIVTR